MITTDTTLTRQTIEQLPNFKKRTSKGEYSSACPFCGGEDRFRFWPHDDEPDKNPNYWCRRCGAKGFVDDNPHIQLDPQALAEWRKAEAERKATETATTLEKIGQLNASNNAARYHHQLTPEARHWWHSKGLNDTSIHAWQLGYTTNCPTLRGAESYTIPVYYDGRLWNIRHRIADADDGNKYRPEMAGLPATMFNADVLQDDSGFVSEVVLVEGEIKTMVLQQYGFEAVGIPGAQTFKRKWLNLFDDSKLVYVALDPGAEDQARRIWQELGEAGIPARLCMFPVKPDDFFVIYGGTPIQFYQWLRAGRIYRR